MQYEPLKAGQPVPDFELTDMQSGEEEPIDAVLAGSEPETPNSMAFGCSIVRAIA